MAVGVVVHCAQPSRALGKNAKPGQHSPEGKGSAGGIEGKRTGATANLRTILGQDHATIMRDLILNYDVNAGRIIDFTYGKGGLWKANIWPDCKKASFWQKYGKFELIRCDAEPDTETMQKENINIIKKDLLVDNYSEFAPCDAGVFDPPYIYGHQVFDHSNKKIPTSMQKQGPRSWATDNKFSENKNPTVFVERVKALNSAAVQCLKVGSLLFVKVMDVRFNGKLILNHDLVEDNLTNFQCLALNVYLAGGAKTWTNHAEGSHGFWQVFRLIKDSKQQPL